MTTAPTSAGSALVRVPKMAELVAHRLRRQIVSGELLGGAALPPEAALMAQFGVSRPTLREAFRVLEAEGLITVRRGAHGGARVRIPSADAASRYAGLVLEHRGATLTDVYDARNIIEPPCAALLARRRTRAHLDELRAQVELTRERLDDPGVAVELLNDFHALLVRLSGNQTLTVLSGMLRQIIDRSTVRHVHALGGSPLNAAALQAGFREHEKVVALITAGDANGADAVWRRHLSAAQQHNLSGSNPGTVLDLLD
jgi:DNA-binding FadR family transcriptional regulator